MSELESLPNIGKKMASRLSKIGIKNSEEFLKRDPYEVFHELRQTEPDLCRCALASIVGASKGVRWHLITKKSAKEYERRHPGHEWGPC